jgi:PKD repeat protein
MKHPTTHFRDYARNIFSKQRLLFLICLFLMLCSGNTEAQTTPGIAISWNSEVGCQTYSDTLGPKPREIIFLENITDGDSIRVCEFSSVIYTLTNAGTSPNTQWTASGGAIANADPDSCQVNWGTAGLGAVTFTVNTPSGLVTHTLSIIIIQSPNAYFTIAPSTTEQGQGNPDVNVCSNQTINFTNLSSVNGGTNLVSYYWNFGDGTTSTVQHPSHIFENPSTYNVTLTVTNACNCSSTYAINLTAEQRGFDIVCPGVVCDGQTADYSLPFDGIQLCNGNFNWTVQGGTITAQADGNLSVIWNQVDTTGFGYVTFDPKDCEVDCPLPTTIKVPVIQTVGTILGNANVCTNDFERYTLPKWPATEFTWEIVGNTDGSLAEVIPTDHRNEVVIKALQQGTLTLRTTYYNTLLHCGGTAEFTIVVGRTVAFSGPDIVCKGMAATYTTDDGTPVNWSLHHTSGGTTTTEYNVSTFTTPALTTVGSYIITVWGTGICAGQSKTLAAIAVPEQPAYNAVFGDEFICPDAPYVYYIANPDPNSQYTWSATNGTVIGSDVGNEVTVKFTGAGPFAIKVFRETLAPISCRSKTTTKTIQLQQINAQIVTSHGLTICGSNYGDYQINTTGTPNLYVEGESYVWSLEDPTLGSIIPNPSIPASGQGFNQIRVLWNNVPADITKALRVIIKKCSITKPVETPITVTISPTIAINTVNNVTTFCGGENITFFVTSSNAVLAANTVINWDFGNGNTIVGAAGAFSITTSLANITLANIGYIVKATILTPNGCQASTTTSINITITPSPTAGVSLSSGANNYCTAAGINAVLTVSTSSGATIQWYKAPDTILTGQTAMTLNVINTTSLGFGSYYFIATKNGCSTTSNSITISQNCSTPVGCSVDPVPILTDNSTVNCGSVTMSASTSYAPTSQSWQIVGSGVAPNPVLTNPGSFTALKAGEYNTYFNAIYSTCLYSMYRKITVPYIVNFNYTVACTGSNIFTISLFDNTDFFSPVFNRNYKYYISTDNVTYTLINGANGPLYALPNCTTATLTPASPSTTYYIKLVVGGELPSGVQGFCEKIIPITIAPTPAQTITYTTPTCYNTPVKFSVTNPQLGDTYLWTFDGVTNNQTSPERVFSAAGTKTVTVVITNKYGCTKTLTIINLIVPPRCFYGDNESNPPNATVCKGATVEIKYKPGINPLDFCSVTQYTLMNGQNQVGPPQASNSFQVSTPGFYWLKVTNGSCTWETETRITPAFINPPSVKIVGPANICQGEPAVLTATTNATTYSWTIDGSAPQSSNTPELNLANLSVGDHTIILTGYDSSTPSPCSASTPPHIINVAEAPATPAISFQLLNNNCAAYQIQLTATVTGSGTFHWSNGATGNTTVVNDGGPYQVKFTNAGGCSSVFQVDVPKNPEDFFWIFPSGCYTICRENLGTVIGPNLLVPSWAWLYNQNPNDTGTNSFMDPFILGGSGTYNMQLNTGLCNKTSLPLNYTRILTCEECDISQITESVTTQNQSYCAFDVVLNILTTGTVGPVTITAPGDEVIINPASFVVGASGSSYNFTVIPINGFPGGVVTLHINGTLPNGSPCLSIFTIILPNCQGSGQSKLVSDEKATTANTSLALYPNPARNEVNIQFDGEWQNAQLEVYDLTGRLLANYNTQQAQGSWQLPLHNMAAGVYVVVLKANNQILMQKKLQVL